MAVDEKQAAKRIPQLREQIRKHDRLYYEEAAPIISDHEYDRLYKELVDLETHLLQRAAVLLGPATGKKNSRAIDLLRQLSKNRAQTLGRGEPEVRSRQFPLLKNAKFPSRGVCA